MPDPYIQLYEELKNTLRKFKYNPATGHGTTEMDLTVEADWLYGEITMVKVTTKNVPRKEEKKN